MPNQEFNRRFREAVSNERLDKYRQRGVGGGDENLLIHYAWNIVLSESLYPILQCMEISLRNSIHDATSAAYNTPLWFDTPELLDDHSRSKIQKAREDLLKNGKPVTAAGIIAEQNFGFWTALFNRRLEQILWPKISRAAFPGLPKHMRTRNIIAGRLNEVRQFRNRVFHHEPIWYIQNLREKHTNILELIAWVNPAMAEFTVAIDRFPGLYSRGMAVFQADLETHFPRAICPSP